MKTRTIENVFNRVNDLAKELSKQNTESVSYLLLVVSDKV